VLKEAVSQLTGQTFAPRRCFGSLFSDGDGDGNPDNDGDGNLDSNNPPLPFTGLFGACNTVGFFGSPEFDAGFAECASQINNNFQGRGVVLFIGQCGFFSSGLSLPRPSGDEAESRFELTGLSPGRYLVQAAPIVFEGGYSSPVRTSFPDPSPNIQSDDNVDFALFPNPQTGEFYNGLPNGCGSSTAACGNELASASDNPFAYTAIEVSAGGRVENVNIFLNTTTAPADILADPGFDFCGLGDVDNNGSVDRSDILAVVQAQAAFDEDPQVVSAHPRADINADGSISFLDIDIITDIVALPRPFGAPTSESKRGLAPFEAICTSAARGGCRIHAPVETIQQNGIPEAAVCDTAEAIGCQVVECQ
jgi:hypothetical protein